MKKIKGDKTYISVIDMFNMEISDFARLKREYMMDEKSLVKLCSNSMDIKILDRTEYLLNKIPCAIRFKEKNIIYYKKNKPKELDKEVLVVELGLSGGNELNMTGEKDTFFNEKKERKYFSRLYIPHLFITENDTSHSEDNIWKFEADTLLEVLEATYKFLKDNKYLQVSIHKGNYD